MTKLYWPCQPSMAF